MKLVIHSKNKNNTLLPFRTRTAKIISINLRIGQTEQNIYYKYDSMITAEL